ncbi:MAG: NIPSNAP family protein [Rhizorhabdus sp.]
MTFHILTSDVVPAHQLGAYVACDWSDVDNVRAGWSVAFGPVTHVLFLQEQTGGEPPAPPPLSSAFQLERRERQWLRAERSLPLIPPEIGIFELRTYDVRQGQGASFLERMLGALPIRERYSRNFGIWSSLSGRLEQVLHLWGYRDLDERAAVRSQLKNDRHWTDYTATILPMLETLQSTILVPLPRCGPA